jgi:hypothetical protein
MTHLVHWRKSNYSVNSSQCVELADLGSAILMRDSKNPGEGHLAFGRAELAAFVEAAKAGELDGMI